MPSLRMRWSVIGLVVLVCVSLPTVVQAQGTGGRILGRVADPSGAVLASVKVVATNDATGVAHDANTNDTGDYVFPDLPVGTYSVTFDLAGFKKVVRHGITLDVNQAITLNMTMQLGQAQEIVDVTSEAPLVDTSTTQLGAVVNNRSVNELPLNARDSYQFLQLQPGVQSQLGSSGGTFYGSDSAGSVSVNGGRDRANNFSVNGGDANDQFVNLPTIQPTPDAIEEFRVISNTFDAEYGRNSGAVVNVVTKSGTNQWHGNVYEYFRNKALNAQGYFNTIKPQFNQNQFGGTFGGPVKKDRTFFFISYEGRRIRQGQSGDIVNIPLAQELPSATQGGSVFSGGFPDLWSDGITPNAVSDQFVADALNGRPNCTTAITNLGGQVPASGVQWNQIFPTDTNGNATIPTECMDPVAVDLLRFVPSANRPDGTYQGVPTNSDNQNQFTIRFDHHINDHQNFSFYYYFTDGAQLQPFYNFQASGANIPGFGAKVNSRYQQYNPSHTWTITNSLVNEFRFTYMREGQLTFQHPQNTGSVQSSCTSAVAAGVCFGGTSDSQAINDLITSSISNPAQAGITTGLPSNRTGVPFIDISGGVAFGNGWEGELPQVGNSFMWADNLTWVKGNHQFKFGADVRRSRFDQTLYYNVSGDFTFDGSTANSIQFNDNYPTYLLGLADSYTQGSAQRENVRSTGLYLFAQDSWKLKPSITLNYGLRWELDTPLTDVLHHVQTFRPGQNTTQYPCTLTPDEQANLGASDCASAGVLPTGLVVPGDQGVQAGLTQTYYKAFAPRVGIAWSPGASGRTSIRAGWGLFYNPMEQLVLEQFGAEPPFGGSTYLPSTFLNTPFVPQGGGYVAPNPFTGILSPKPGSDTDWASFRPMLLYGDFQPKMRTQYTAQYNLTIQRELAKDIVLQVGYVGSQGHRLLASHDINAANPASCLGIAALADTDPTWVTDGFGTQATCSPFAEDNSFLISPLAVAPQGGLVIPYTGNGGGNPATIPANTVIGTVAPNGIFLPGLRPYSSPNCNPYSGGGVGTGCPTDGLSVFSNVFAEDTIAASAYNSFQASVEKRFSHGLQFQAAYTLSKSLDWASSFEETVNPFNYKDSRALSLFNSKQRFVINYVWDIPVRKYNGFAGKVLDDWQFSGIIQFQSGFPIRLQTQDDTELISSLFFLGAAAPQLNGPLQIVDPKQVQTFNTYNYGEVTGHYYLNADQSKFTDPALGTFGTTPRSVCCGPGENQWDITIAKRIALSESRYFQFRADVFNLFNKTQFVNPDGNFSNQTFGQVLQARDPRLLQFALKFYF
ncbi:MAG TPA: carboxypeptidase regulatory-like domain-containing protein [Candidatus Solibacter sp.]|nr:carboxypeptidase regulatory-like domain-containing protein [Candidatus Solibacter sp.]